ncbi:MAG: DUF4097 family beta strand repeat protein [Candidatus Aminicenantes bacterium]|nr:DUF4097 family beta strand repeat protein [Candidatus Aminicenantes bacterium]
MKVQKIIIVITMLLAFMLALGVFPTTAVAKEKYEEKFEKTVSLAKDGKVYLKNISGDIQVMTWGKDEVKIDALKISRASSMDRAKENADKVKIEITEESGVLRIETDYPKMNFGNLNVSVDFKVTIPDHASADINSVSGDIRIEKAGGATKAESVSGDVNLEDIGGTLRGKSVSGDVNVRGAAKGADINSVSGDVAVYDVVGDADLKTVSGEITAARIKGSIEAESVSGDVELTDVSDAGVVKAKALSGEVIYLGTINRDGRYEFKSHSGDIRLTIPGSSAFDLEAKTFSGDIDSEFEMTISGKLSRKSIKGSVNGGGAVVELNTFSGDVLLRKN